MHTLKDAIELLEQSAKTYNNASEILPIECAQNRILAQDIYATKSLPSFDNSAMDGYALNAKDSNKTLKIQTTIFAGDLQEITLEENACVKIMTGAKIPKGANCVVPFEEIEGGFGNSTHISTPEHLQAFANLRKCGEEITQNTLLIKRGTLLNAEYLTLIATQGISHIRVFKPLNLVVFTSGNELKEPWEMANASQIYNSNATMVQGILKSLHFSSTYGGILQDTLEAITLAFETPSDVIFTTGGASKGEADFIRQVLEQNGAKILINGVQIKPGKPIMVAHFKQKFIIALPGNPLAGGVMLRTLILPFLMQLSGANAHYPQYICLKAAANLKRKARTEALLGSICKENIHFTKNGKYGSGEVTPMAQSNALVLLDESYGEIKEGDMLKVLPFFANFGEEKQDCINRL